MGGNFQSRLDDFITDVSTLICVTQLIYRFTGAFQSEHEFFVLFHYVHVYFVAQKTYNFAKILLKKDSYMYWLLYNSKYV